MDPFGGGADYFDNLAKQKKDYIEQNVIQTGYDENYFKEYLNYQKGKLPEYNVLDDGENLDNWDFGELQQVVYDF